MTIKLPGSSGLSTAEATRLLRRDGPNELPGATNRGRLELIKKTVSEPMFLLLIACGAIYLMLGDRQEAIMLLGFVFVVIGITLVQQQRAEKSLSALRELSGPQALAVRDGKVVRIPGKELVCGDLVLLSEGDRVPADISLLETSNLTVDESMLTGESVPVLKQSAVMADISAGATEDESTGIVFSGTLVTQGTGRGYVIATGVRSALGKIGASLEGIGQSSTPVQLETQHVVRYVAIGGFALAGVLTGIYWWTTERWLEGILVGLTLAMAVIPEELPVTLTIFLALGAWRLSQKSVLARHVPVMEFLGATTVLCVDKTGTLTANKMVLRRICSESAHYDVSLPHQSPLPESLHEVMEFSVLASHRRAFDPMETAIADAGKCLLANTEHLHSDWVLIEDYPLSPKMLAMSRVWQSPDQRSLIIAAKGAPEAIIDLCHLDPVRVADIGKQVSLLAAEGLRLLAIAKASIETDELPDNQHDFDFEFLGLIALEDPIRPDVPQAIAQCRAAGIRVMMLTGDHPATAASIGKQVGLSVDGKVMTGSELARLDESQLQTQLAEARIFCRIHPQQKLRIVQALRAQGEVVAMTGDGVNDAPALKAADIGIAMGARGTEVAREAADIVLLNDDFCSIVTAIRDGRRVFANLRKAIVFIVAVHVPIVGLSVIPVILGWPIILMPVHILSLQLIIDPACSIVFEAESAENDVMKSKPRPHDQRLFDAKILRRGLWQGGGLLLLLLGIHAGMHHMRNPDDMTRALTFIALVLLNLGLIYVTRFWGPTPWKSANSNQYWAWIVLIELMLLAIVMSIPFLRAAFSFSIPSPGMLAVGVATVFSGLLWLEVVKYVDR